MAEIKCKVDSCRYNEAKDHCTLSSISVSNDAPMHEAESTHETQCSSFEGQ